MVVKKIEVTDLKKVIASNNLVIGTDKTLKDLKNGKITRVFIASNCPDETKEAIKYYCGISRVQFEEIKEDDDEFGIICKKQFSISVAGVLKSK